MSFSPNEVANPVIAGTAGFLPSRHERSLHGRAESNQDGERSDYVTIQILCSFTDLEL